MHVGQGEPVLEVAHLHGPVRLRSAEEALDVVPGDVGEVRAALVGRDPPCGPDRTQQGAGQGPRADTGLHHVRPGEDVGQSDDRSGVLGVDHGGPARHRQHEVAQQGAQDQVGHSGEGGHDDPLGLADEVVVGQGPLVGVELLARDQGNVWWRPFGSVSWTRSPGCRGPCRSARGVGAGVGTLGWTAQWGGQLGGRVTSAEGGRLGHGLTLCAARGGRLSPSAPPRCRPRAARRRPAPGGRRRAAPPDLAGRPP